MNTTPERDHCDRNSVHRARLHWQCRRGILELDLALQSFLDQRYGLATGDELRAFETLLSYPDPLLLEYVMGRMMPSDPILAHVIDRLRSASAA